MTWAETDIADALKGKFYRTPPSERPYTQERRSVNAEDQKCIVAMYGEGKTHRQMAAEIGVSAGTIGRCVLRLIRNGTLQRRKIRNSC